MSIEVRPLFRLEVVRPQIRAAELPPLAGDVLARLQNWSELISGGKIDRQKETQILPDFLTDLFGGVLGYTLPAAATDGRYTLQRESFITPGTEYADAALGRLPGSNRDLPCRSLMMPHGSVPHRRTIDAAIDPHSLVSSRRTITAVACSLMHEPDAA